MKGNFIVDEDLDLHLLARMVPFGDRHLIFIAPNKVEVFVRKHLRYVAYVSPYFH